MGVTGGPGRVWGRRSNVQEGASRDSSASSTGSASDLDGMRRGSNWRKGAREVIEGCPAARGGRWRGVVNVGSPTCSVGVGCLKS